MAYHFKPYLNEPLDTVDKHRAWGEIVDFLDNIPEIKIPKIIEICYENTSDYREYHDKITELNDRLSKEIGIKYDENMRVIIVKD